MNVLQRAPAPQGKKIVIDSGKLKNLHWALLEKSSFGGKKFNQIHCGCHRKKPLAPWMYLGTTYICTFVITELVLGEKKNMRRTFSRHFMVETLPRS